MFFSFIIITFRNLFLKFEKRAPTQALHTSEDVLRSKKLNNISRLCCVEHFWSVAWTCHLQMQITNWPLILRIKPLFQPLPKMKNDQLSFIFLFGGLHVVPKCIFIELLIPRISFLEWLSENGCIFSFFFLFFFLSW